MRFVKVLKMNLCSFEESTAPLARKKDELNLKVLDRIVFMSKVLTVIKYLDSWAELLAKKKTIYALVGFW